MPNGPTFPDKSSVCRKPSFRNGNGTGDADGTGTGAGAGAALSRKNSSYSRTMHPSSIVAESRGNGEHGRVSRKNSMYRNSGMDTNGVVDRNMVELQQAFPQPHSALLLSDHGFNGSSLNGGIQETSNGTDRRRHRNQHGHGHHRASVSRRESVKDRRDFMSIEKTYDSNEQRMKNLERMVDELTNELKRYDNGNMLNDFGERHLDGDKFRM